MISKNPSNNQGETNNKIRILDQATIHEIEYIGYLEEEDMESDVKVWIPGSMN